MNQTAERPSQELILALSKGRIFEETMPLLEAAGITVLEDPETSRKLILPTNKPQVRVIIVRATDVPTYVQYGAADFGVAGKDVLQENGSTGLYRRLICKSQRCRLSVAVKKDFDYEKAIRQGARLRVASKYVQAAREHFAKKGIHVDIIKLYGSMELAPLVGPFRRHRRSGQHRKYTKSKQSGRSRTDTGNHVPSDSQPGFPEIEAPDVTAYTGRIQSGFDLF